MRIYSITAPHVFLSALLLFVWNNTAVAEDAATPSIIDGVPYGKSTASENSENQDESDGDKRGPEYAGIPALFSTPETGLGGGGAFVYLGPSIKTRRDFALVGATITERKQFLAAGLIEIFDPQEYFSIETHFTLTRYPDFFYGVGNSTRDEDKDLYTMRTREIGVALKVAPESFQRHQIGFGLHQEITDFDEFTATGILTKRNYPGKHGGVTRDLTLSWQYQKNDEDFSPHDGIRISWDLYRSTKALGSEFENIRFWSNNALFIPLTNRSTLALQLYGEFTNGEIPWYQLAQTGGTNLLRGYFRGKYRDKQLLATQAEIRRHLFSRVGVVAFAAVGQVAPKPHELLSGAPLAAWGTGLRYRLTKNQRINARLDLGFNRKEPMKPSLYLYILEAF